MSYNGSVFIGLIIRISWSPLCSFAYANDKVFSSNQRCLLLISNEDIHLYSISSNCNQMERIWLRSYMSISYYNNRCYRIFYSRFCFLSVTNLCTILMCSRIKFTFRTGHKNLQNFPSFLFKWPFAFCPPSFFLPNDLTR